MDTLDKNRERAANFHKMEDKIKSVLMKCKAETLVDSNDIQNEFGLSVHRIANATRVEHYLIPEGLHVYKYYDGINPIDYLVTAKPLFTGITRLLPDNTTYEGRYFSGISCLEYSRGNVGNSVPIDNTAKYYDESHISLLSTDVYSTDELNKEVTATSTGPLEFGKVSNYTPYYMGEISELRSIAESGDLFTYINKSESKDAYIEKALANIKDTTALINEVYLARNEKKGLLYALLGKNKFLSSQIDAFKAHSKGR